MILSTSHWTHIKELIRYGIVTLVSYVFLYGGTYFLVEQQHMSPRLSYSILITLTYIGVYIAYTLFVFEGSFETQTFKRFIGVLLLSWLCNIAFFNLLNHVLGIPYLIVMLANTFILGVFRFTLQKFYVFQKATTK